MSDFADFLANNVPWDINRPQIFQFVQKHWKEEDNTLPDEGYFFEENARWASGALDGVFVYHNAYEADERVAEELFSAFEQLVTLPSEQNLLAFYQLFFREHNVITFIDDFLESVIHEFLAVHQSSGNEVYVYNVFLLAQWLTLFSPDREPVKFGMALMGLFPDIEETREAIITLGFHDEFTLFSLVGIQNIFKDPEQEIWVLAQVVKGWGRIHCVARLAGTQSDEIKRWLVREGYKNEILYEYLSYICATTGDLLSELEKTNPDTTLLEGAGDILAALIRGGPVEEMKDYEEGAEAISLFLQHLSRAEASLEQYVIVQEICGYVREEAGWDQQTTEKILETAQKILDRSDWKKRALEAIRSQEDFLFYTASQVLKFLNIDTWEYHFERQRSEEGEEWHTLMQTNDLARIDRVLELAKQTIPLEEIATGISDDVEWGPKFYLHQSLEFILDRLGSFPRKGWEFIKAGLSSPVVRNRSLSVNALSHWTKDNWPDEAWEILRNLSKIEPDAEVKEKILQLIST